MSIPGSFSKRPVLFFFWQLHHIQAPLRKQKPLSFDQAKKGRKRFVRFKTLSRRKKVCRTLSHPTQAF